MKKLRIVTRNSKLALAQVEWVKNKLSNFFPELTFQTIELVTSGDKFLSAPLYKIGGKGLFVKELDDALLNDEADIAVHSVKDIPQVIPAALCLPTICKRENPLDAWICPKGVEFMTLPSGSIVGTSSLRRIVQLRKMRDDLTYLPLRGNVLTRIQKCEQGEFDGIVLAKAGLIRLNLEHKITHVFSPEEVLPAVGQGAIGIMTRKADEATQALLAPLNHLPTYYCVMAERTMNRQLNGSCQVPIAGFAIIHDETITLSGRVGHPVKPIVLSSQKTAPKEEYVMLGETVANELVHQGAKELLADLEYTQSR